MTPQKTLFDVNHVRRITFDVVSDILSVAIQIMVLWGLIYKVKKFRKKDV